MKRSIWDTTDYCPICGVELRGMMFKTHKCSNAKLRAMDAAMKSDHNRHENKKPFYQRLADGFALLDDEDHGDD